ncbi:uncharacterized protein LOC108157694 [Drosophila miranda]|uniref:uncharacterized protein LOC108157694 n=1 Tax=Drosophila miranda TaxID=7229 RepID=UPI0007E63CE4|nr:uncharacterized protein LOC108157694 [Drosophila miranda]
MCCWCARVYWTVLHNLFARFLGSIEEQNCCRCCAGYQRQASDDDDVDVDVGKQVSDTDDEPQQQPQRDYVTADDTEANYSEIEEHNIETEAYYFTVDRPIAERMLAGREDGACLVRPFKTTDVCIKYIVSICVGDQFYHLFVRQIDRRQRFAIGQKKLHERIFASPREIVDFYSEHPLLCTNKSQSQCVRLTPISYA